MIDKDNIGQLPEHLILPNHLTDQREGLPLEQRLLEIPTILRKQVAAHSESHQPGVVEVYGVIPQPGRDDLSVTFRSNNDTSCLISIFKPNAGFTRYSIEPSAQTIEAGLRDALDFVEPAKGTLRPINEDDLETLAEQIRDTSLKPGAYFSGNVA